MKQGSNKVKTYKSGTAKQLMDDEDEELTFNNLPKDLERDIDVSDNTDQNKEQLKKLA